MTRGGGVIQEKHMYAPGKTINCKDGSSMTILETIRERNRKRHKLIRHRKKSRSGALLFGQEKLIELTSKAIRKLER